MRNIILAVIITAGVTIPTSFLTGALLTRHTRDELKNQKKYYQQQLAEANSITEEMTCLMKEATRCIKSADDQIKSLKSENEILKKEILALKTPPSFYPEIKLDHELIFRNLYLDQSSYTTFFNGEFFNAGTSRWDMGNFFATFYGLNGEVLGTADFSFNHIKPNQSRGFSIITSIDADKIVSRIEIERHWM